MASLRENRIPCDVLHLDTGWFETDWQCDYEFSTTRFTDPKKMLSDLTDEGFRISCWQLPYFVPKNKLFPELVAPNLVVRDRKGDLPYEDALPGDTEARELSLTKTGDSFKLDADPLAGKVAWAIHSE